MAGVEQQNPAVGSDAFLKRMREQFALDAEQERENREEARKDIQFRAGDQWDPKAAKARRDADRPVLVFNKMAQFVAQIANEARQNKPTIKFSPVDNLADVDTAKVYEELARAIQYQSDADVAYENAADGAAGNAFAYFELSSDYCDNETFDQDLKFSPIMDPFSVYGVMIPTALRRPINHAFKVETITREEYTQQYGDSNLASWGFDSEQARINGGDWIGREMVRVAVYWWIEWEKRTLTAGDKTRTVQVPKVNVCKTNGVEVFEGSETEWPGTIIPVFGVLGSQVVLDGVVKLFSLIRWIRDPQVMINFAKTRIVETLATAPVSPFMGPKGFMGQQKNIWEKLNQNITAALEFEVVQLPNGQYWEHPPQRNTFEPPIAALSAFVAQEEEDLKSGTGIYDARLGSKGNETSGIAIQRRNQQSETANYHFLDNLARAQRQAGRALAEVMPVFYDTPRWLRVIGEDETERMVRVNEPYQDPDTGEVKHHILGAGKYDVRVITGPAYATKRQETAEMLAGVFQANPQLLNVMGDIYFRNSDAAGADEMAERMKKWISSQAPGLIEDKKQTEIPPEVQQGIQQMQQDHQALNEYAKGLEKKADEVQAKYALEYAKLDLEKQKLAADIALKEAQISSVEEIQLLKAKLAQIEAELDRGHQMDMASQQAMHQQQAQAEQAAMEAAQPEQEEAPEQVSA